MPKPLITLTTDFGLRDSYVAQMKACLLTQAPESFLLDISHDIEAGDITHAAYLLRDAAPLFPDSSVHLVVVDPGVGTSRKRIVLRLRFETGVHWFVGPDNGVFSLLLDSAADVAAWEIRTEQLGIKAGSLSTFDGRDVFAPVAARLSNGEAAGNLGLETSVDNLFRLRLPEVQRSMEPEGLRFEGELIYFDRFGNAISNIPYEARPLRGSCELHTSSEVLAVQHYASYERIPKGALGLIRNSQNYWEISAKGASAQTLKQLSLGMRVCIRYTP